jgi:hypothetical protein
MIEHQNGPLNGAEQLKLRVDRSGKLALLQLLFRITGWMRQAIAPTLVFVRFECGG